MREWRKLYRAITSSERLAGVSDAACWLYVLLLASQDDGGRFPWTQAMVRSLTATRAWPFPHATELRNELVAAGLCTLEGGMVVLRNGAALNGVPRSAHDRTPRLYPAPLVESPSVPQDIAECAGDADRDSRVAQTASKGERYIALVPEGKEDWFAPVTRLPGYRHRDDARAVAAIVAACAARGVAPGLVVETFAAYWPTGRVRHGWRDPVAALVRTLDVQIGKALRTPAREAVARHASPASLAAAERSKQLGTLRVLRSGS